MAYSGRDECSEGKPERTLGDINILYGKYLWIRKLGRG